LRFAAVVEHNAAEVRLTMIGNIVSAALFLLGIGTAIMAQQPSVSNCPADVRVTFSDSRTYKGSYSSKATARTCGETNPLYFGKKTFSFEFPEEAKDADAIQDVTFDSEELVGGRKSAAGFMVSVSVKTKEIGHPPDWVVDTTNQRDKASGSASLGGTDSETTLTVKATNSLGEKLELLVTCHAPKQ
jgi:hypothetical protein